MPVSCGIWILCWQVGRALPSSCCHRVPVRVPVRGPVQLRGLPDVPSFQNAALASPVTGDLLFSKYRASSAPPVCVDLSWVIGPKGA